METKATEKLIARIWQHKPVTELVTTDGEQINVIHPGRSSNTSGCDFQDAVFVINGALPDNVGLPDNRESCPTIITYIKVWCK